MDELLERDEFRRAVFARDGHRCVICGAGGEGDPDHRDYTLDAHHIVERRLFTAPGQEGGYYRNNGATLCPVHHRAAEQTVLSCEEIRERAAIRRIVLPEHLYEEFVYTKWGDIVQPNGTRLKGELFFDASVQKILAEGGVLGLYAPYVKYPRTHHLPTSNPSKDDKVIESLRGFEGEEVVATVKMDGEQTSMYRDHIHARSLDLATGLDKGHVKAIHAAVAHEIPEGWRVCGENLYATHSLHYTWLDSYFYVFGIWNERNECLAWDETVEWAELLGLRTVPVLYRGPWDANRLLHLYEPEYRGEATEGYVVRVARRFAYGEFKRVVAKWVRPNHVTTANHWRHQRLVPNRLAEDRR
ncbi:hypothetical protein EON79_13115 [bacterium]|nr:MAG: hypothetical protein EON79_13115 [bacterium]